MFLSEQLLEAVSVAVFSVDFLLRFLAAGAATHPAPPSSFAASPSSFAERRF
jgi:hypothetical protein